MTEQKKTKNVVRRRNKSAIKKMRDEKIRAMALEGSTQREIAEAVGLCPDQVGRILNNAESKRLLKEAQNAIKLMIPEALATFKDAMANRNEFQMMGHAIKVANSVLKSEGVIREKVELEHTFPKPTVIKRISGEEVVLGFQGDENDDEDQS